MWPVLYALFVILALNSPPDAWADDERDYPADDAAEINLQEQRWAFTKSLRVELAKSENLRLETTIPLDSAEKSKLSLGIATKVSRNWSFNLSVWAVL